MRISLSHYIIDRDLAFPEEFKSFHDVIFNNISYLKLITPSCISTRAVHGSD